MYYIPLLLIILFCIMENRLQDRKNFFYSFIFIILLLMLCFRYGQGTDYFGYKWNYINVDRHSEIGYQLLQDIFRQYGVLFEGFIFVVSFFQMLCIYRAIRLFSPYKSLSLLLLYPTIYLTYFFSAIRQGIVIAFFLGFMLKWLLDGKWVKYLLACGAMISVHSISIVLIPLLLVRYMKRKYLYCCVFVAALFGIAVYFIPNSWFSFINIGSFQYYLNGFSVSYIGLLERVIMLFIVVTLWAASKENLQENDPVELIYKIYLCGFIISIIFFPWSMMSSRLPAAMKATEIILIPILLKIGKKWRQVILAILICYALVMTTKNLYSYIAQGEYKNCNVITYPYISVFNKEKVEIRNVPYTFKE